MTTKAHEERDGFEAVPFRMHPRVFAALGADLVTNDVVAVIELVKNSYDAFAENVRLRFGNDEPLGPFLEIEDDGKGMTRDIIENVWCLVATPLIPLHFYFLLVFLVFFTVLIPVGANRALNAGKGWRWWAIHRLSHRRPS